jgi:hypothetical protein
MILTDFFERFLFSPFLSSSLLVNTCSFFVFFFPGSAYNTVFAGFFPFSFSCFGCFTPGLVYLSMPWQLGCLVDYGGNKEKCRYDLILLELRKVSVWLTAQGDTL